MIILAEHVPIEEARVIIARHSNLRGCPHCWVRWHTRQINPSATAMLYDIYCLACDPPDQTEPKED